MKYGWMAVGILTIGVLFVGCRRAEKACNSCGAAPTTTFAPAPVYNDAFVSPTPSYDGVPLETSPIGSPAPVPGAVIGGSGAR